MFRFLLLFGLFLGPLFGEGTLLEINESRVYDLGKSLNYYADTNKSETFRSVLHAPFHPCKRDVPSFGFSASAYWFRLNLLPSSEVLNDRWFLKIEYPLLDSIDLYGIDSDGALLFEKHGGELEPFGSRELSQRHFIFEVPFVAGQELTLLLRVETMGSLQLPITLQRGVDLLVTQQSRLLLIGVYYGIFLIIFVYNMILFFYTWDRNYIRYLLFLSSFIMWQLSFDGLGAEYFWTDQWWSIHHGTAFWIIFSSFSAILFGRYFLQTSEFAPKLDAVLLLTLFISGTSSLLATFISYDVMVRVGAFLAIVTPLLLLSSGIVVWKRGHRAARFYIMGWSAFLVGSALFSLNKFDAISGFYMINYAQQIGSALEMLFLSWALADRVNMLQVEYNEKLRRLNMTLQERVRETLDHMRKKDQMLSHQARLASMGEMIEQIAHQWRQPLNNMALLNQDTYVKMSLGILDNTTLEKNHDHINDNLQYMSKTIDDFRTFFAVESESVTCNLSEIIDDTVKLTESTLHYSSIEVRRVYESDGRIRVKKNELMQVFMNLVKNSIDVIKEKERRPGRITIRMTTLFGRAEIYFEDNGGGIRESQLEEIFKPYVSSKKEGTGIGLYLSRAIVEKYHGTISVTNGTQGACFHISLPLEVETSITDESSRD